MPRVKSKSSEQINIAKLERKHLQEQQKRIKPGECLKYIKVVIDPIFLSGAPGSQILSTLVNSNIKYEIRSQKIPSTICWERSTQQTLIPLSEQAISMSAQYEREDQLLYLLHGEEFLSSIRSNSLDVMVKNLKSNYPGASISIMLFGLKRFCKTNHSGFTRIQIETAVTELQVMHDCNCRLYETAEEVATTVMQFTKAVSEIPFKKQISDKYADANLFLLNDNKDCVRVDGTAGLSRLWQQHLTRLPQVTLEVAEAVIAKYPCPVSLINEYEQHECGPDVLADLNIRRAGGPLQTIRRIGPELSKKIHTLYTSLDADEIL